MGDVWEFEFHPFKSSWWSVVLKDVGLRNWVQKAFGDYITWVSRKKIVCVSHTMRLNLCGGGLVQLGRTNTICFKPCLMIHDVQRENPWEI